MEQIVVEFIRTEPAIATVVAAVIWAGIAHIVKDWVM